MKVIKAEDTRSLEPFRDRIIEGDCLEVMKGIPGESIDMILCDLPYGPPRINGIRLSTSTCSLPSTCASSNRMALSF